MITSERLLIELKSAWIEGRIKDFHRISGVLQQACGISLTKIEQVKEVAVAEINRYQ